jgi:hypothetical protein
MPDLCQPVTRMPVNENPLHVGLQEALAGCWVPGGGRLGAMKGWQDR